MAMVDCARGFAGIASPLAAQALFRNDAENGVNDV